MKENDNSSQTDTLPRKENENEASQVQQVQEQPAPFLCGKIYPKK